ncbi:MAG TPA: DUF6807 family protein [bacterium]|nr:DUF6807 family protein [bacterium]
MKQRRFAGAVVFIFLLTSMCAPQPDSTDINLELQATDYSAAEIPVSANVQLPAGFRRVSPDEIVVTLGSDDGAYADIPGQIVATDDGGHQLWWILPETGQTNPARWTATLIRSREQAAPAFHWENTPAVHLDLLLNQKRVFRYSYEMDDQFEEGETLTALNKAFYHIFDLQGADVITNGPKEGLWSHHRGIMIGWRDVGFQGEELSFWGMEDLTVQKHIEFLREVAGPVLGQTRALIHWNDSTGTTIIEEEREATIYRQSPPAILMLDFTSTLRASDGPVMLDGNAEHGGVQYRAHNDVADEAPGAEQPTYYFHRDNIDPHEDYNLPWVGMSYGLRNNTYSVLDMDHPDNPDSTIWSAYRDYGRFGPFFRTDLDANETLTIHYRFWISEDSMPDRDVLASKYAAYVNPPEVSVLAP